MLRRQHERERQDHFHQYLQHDCSRWCRNVASLNFCGGHRNLHQIHVVEMATEEPLLGRMTMNGGHAGQLLHLRPFPRNGRHSNDVLCQQNLRVKTETALPHGDGSDMMWGSVGGSAFADSGHT